MSSLSSYIATELGVREPQVRAAIDLLDGGATVPFVARYRKEATGGLDDVQLRQLESRLVYLRELAGRRAAIIKSIGEQGKLTPPLRAAIEAADTKQTLEDLYLPYKPKRRTKGQIAREFGLEPLADLLFDNPNLHPEQEALAHVQLQKGEGGEDLTHVGAVLDGVRDILSERWAEDAILIQGLRQWLWHEGRLQSRLTAGQDPNNPDTSKFRDYFEYDEPIANVPSHRALAVFRGRTQQLLDVKLQPPDGPVHAGAVLSEAEQRIARHLGWQHQNRPADDLLRKCVGWTWRVKLALSLERDLFARLRTDAERVAIDVFANNLRDLLLAAPAGQKTVLGLDPGIRTGVKVAVVDQTGKLLETATIYPHPPRKDWAGSLKTLRALVIRHRVDLIAIGNGTASRETDRLAAELIDGLHSGGDVPVPQKVVVSEAGASVYSASEYASRELPDVDVSLRGAASIARRLQDPLAELVKIDPKSIGVGQYQHDVNQLDLARTLDTVVEDCVNSVGVDLNTASSSLLARVSGLSTGVANRIVEWRETHGAFGNRQQLLAVTGLGPKTFEQSAGFLRIRQGDNPLDRTGVHPESYPLVEQIMLKTNASIGNVMGNAQILAACKPEQFVDVQWGLPTVRDVLRELEKPGRDPRGDFQMARLSEGVNTLADLREGMELEGAVSNVAAFGAFVDVGVHQDGLVHVSQLADRFVRDPHEVIRAGQIVKVRVLEVDHARGRISLTMKRESASQGNQGRRDKSSTPRHHPSPNASSRRTNPSTAMASAFENLKRSSQ